MSVECGQGGSLIPGDTHVLPAHPLISVAVSIGLMHTVASTTGKNWKKTIVLIFRGE